MKSISRKILIGFSFLALIGCRQSTAATSIEDALETVVLVVVGANGQPTARGSGMFTDEDGRILTNAHVVTNDQMGEAWSEVTILTTTSAREPAQCFATADVLAVDEELDLALLEIVSPLDTDCDETEEFDEFWYTDTKTDSAATNIGDELTVIGFPAYSGGGEIPQETVTVTRGHVSGFVGGDGENSEFIKTDTMINHGNSGGAAFDKEGNFVGIPSQGRWDDSEIGGVLGLLIPASVVDHWFDRLRDQGVIE
jgi:serine protease Do